jgi:hypothetical protein
MRSVADELREEQRRELLALTASERVALALELGERALAIFQSASGLSREEALRELERRRQHGRRPCSFLPGS